MIPCGRIALFVLVAVTFAFPGALRATVYKWQDEDGNVHFTDDLLNVPPTYRDEVSVKDLPELSENVIPAPQPASPPSPNQTASKPPPTADPGEVYAECVKKVEEEKQRWTDQLTQDRERLGELDVLIRRTVTSRHKNAYQRERVALKERIEQTESALREDLPPMEEECESFRYWNVRE